MNENIKKRFADISLSIVIPIFNEERSVISSINFSLNQIAQILDDFEIIIVDDGSTDNTLKILQKNFSKNPKIHILQNLINLNQGVSIQRGFAHAKKNFVMHNGIDLPFRFEDLVNILPLLKMFDVVVVERIGYSGYTSWRRLTSLIWRIQSKVLFNIPFHDLNFVQFYRTAYVKNARLLSRSPAFTSVEYIIRAFKLRLKITSIKCKYSRRKMGSPQLGKPNDIIWSLYDMLRFYLFTIKSKNFAFRRRAP